MPILVDGDNLLGRWPGRARSQGQRVLLSHELQRAARRMGSRIHVCFDGSRPDGIGVAAQSHWSGADSSADEWIVAFLENEKDPKSWSVVTDDRPLGDRCRWIGATIRGCRDFRLRLQGEVPEKPERENDIDYWIDTFNAE